MWKYPDLITGIHAANHTAAQEAHQITFCLPNGKVPDVELLKSYYRKAPDVELLKSYYRKAPDVELLKSYYRKAPDVELLKSYYRKAPDVELLKSYYRKAPDVELLKSYYRKAPDVELLKSYYRKAPDVELLKSYYRKAPDVELLKSCCSVCDTRCCISHVTFSVFLHKAPSDVVCALSSVVGSFHPFESHSTPDSLGAALSPSVIQSHSHLGCH